MPLFLHYLSTLLSIRFLIHATTLSRKATFSALLFALCPLHFQSDKIELKELTFKYQEASIIHCRAGAIACCWFEF